MEVPFDRGIVVLDNDFNTVPRSRFLGEPSDGDTVARATGHQLRLQHDFNDQWSLLVGASHRDTLLTGASSDAETLRSRQKLYVDGHSLSRQRRTRHYTSEHSVLRAEVTGEFETGTLRHRILIGGDFDHFDTDQVFTRFRGPVVTDTTTDQAGYVLDLQNPVYGRYPAPVTTPLTDRLDVQRTSGAYVQDQISLTDRLQVRIGGRYDDFLLRVDDRLTDVLGRRKRARFSPQVGIVYELGDPLSLYAAYGEGYRANIGADAAGKVFEPETSKSIEAGVKLTALGGGLTGTLAVYQLEKSNVLATDTRNPGFSVAIGKARSRGVELDVNGRLPGDVDLLLSYAYTDAEARSRVLDPAFSFQIEPGDPLINIPDHNLNVQATKRFSLGTRNATPVPLPDLPSAVLPPALPWSGASERLIVAKDDPWITPAERAGFITTPGYAETREWLERLDAASPLVSIETFGQTGEGRDLLMPVSCCCATSRCAARPSCLTRSIWCSCRSTMSMAMRR